MDDSPLVRRGEADGDLSRDLDGAFLAKRPAVDPLS